MVLPETFAHVDGDDPTRAAQALDGPIVAVARKARAYRTYATVPLWLRDGSTIYNSTVLLDRQGQPVGVYHKVYPVVMPDGSLESGITPGHEFPVFELEFGRVGIQICFDACYDAGWEALGSRRRSWCCSPPAGDRPSPPSGAFAYRHGYYVVLLQLPRPAVAVDPLWGTDPPGPAGLGTWRWCGSTWTTASSPPLPVDAGRDQGALRRGAVDFGWHDAQGPCLPDLPRPGAAHRRAGAPGRPGNPA